jgi:hypothetical protein
MPKQTQSIPNEVILARLGDREALSDELWLIAAQVGMLLGRSQDQLAEDRKVGNPPPFKKDGGSIRYRLGTVRDHMFGLPEYTNTTQARVAAGNAHLGIPFSSFLSWIDFAKPDDVWPFLIRRKDGPVDYWTSLTLGDQLNDGDYCEWLRLDDYLKHRRRAAWENWLPERSPREANASLPVVPMEMVPDNSVNELWAAAKLYRLVEVENARNGLARFERELVVRFLDQASQSYLRDLANLQSGGSNPHEHDRVFKALLADLDRFRRQLCS